MQLDMEVTHSFESESTRMSDMLTFELDDKQRDVLLRGLRYVRRSVMLTPQDPTDEIVEGRNAELAQLSELSDLLSGKPVAQETSV